MHAAVRAHARPATKDNQDKNHKQQTRDNASSPAPPACQQTTPLAVQNTAREGSGRKRMAPERA
eukprot:6807620-Alexandrium_andersonii.AAC.1